MMGNEKSREIALRYVTKRMSDHSHLYDSDDMYGADSHDKDLCSEYIDEIMDKGLSEFKKEYGL